MQSFGSHPLSTITVAELRAGVALLPARVRASGLAMASADGCIAAIAAANGLTVATRDTGPFEAAGVAVINPWRA